MLVQHLRKRQTVRNESGNPVPWKGRPYATMVAEKSENGQVVIGWSKCNNRDIFSCKVGVAKAVAAIKHPPAVGKIPYEILDAMPRFRTRCEAYFKTDNIVVVGKAAPKPWSPNQAFADMMGEEDCVAPGNPMA